MLTPRSEKPPRGLISKWNSLLETIASLGPLVVAFSGGLDSSLLVAAATFALGSRKVKAVTCIGPLTPPWEISMARAVARAVGVGHVEVEAGELLVPEVAANGPMRCYHCKLRRLELLKSLGQGWAVAEGSSASDDPRTRPGMRAVAELGVASPLRQAGLGRSEIASLARWAGLGWVVRPSGACLATRFALNTPLTHEGLARVARAEGGVREILGEALQVRVRDHWPVARLELGRGGWRIVRDGRVRRAVVEVVKAAGYRRVCLDLEGYEEGGAN